MKVSEVIRLLDPGRWAALLIGAALLILALLVLNKCASDARREADLAKTTGRALDRVARETPAIRQDQKERQDEIDQIPGADQRLPDGFGERLERVRRGERNPG